MALTATSTTSTTVFAQIVDADFPGQPDDGHIPCRPVRGELEGSSRFYESDSYNGLSWDALRFANAETSPDPIVSMWSSNGQLIPLGSLTTEYWGLSGTLDFTFAPLQGRLRNGVLAAGGRLPSSTTRWPACGRTGWAR
jgi:hypothetical protein